MPNGKNQEFLLLLESVSCRFLSMKIANWNITA